MQGVKIRNDLFSPSNVKCVTVNYAPNSHQKNFMNSVQNARKTLGCLERSILKSNQYEQKLLHCKGSHNHSHGVNEWWDSGHSEKSFKYSNTTSTSNSKLSRSQDDCIVDTWSTMSIVCLQYQYEELAKRYKTLIQAYEEQCKAVGLRDESLEQWQKRANSTHAHLTHTHETLLTVGEKYLALKQKKNVQKSWYEDQLAGVRQALHDMMEATTRARMSFDVQLKNCMANERNSDAALLLYEIRKCNLLFLENMRLKALIEELIPGQLDWKT